MELRIGKKWNGFKIKNWLLQVLLSLSDFAWTWIYFLTYNVIENKKYYFALLEFMLENYRLHVVISFPIIKKYHWNVILFLLVFNNDDLLFNIFYIKRFVLFLNVYIKYLYFEIILRNKKLFLLFYIKFQHCICHIMQQKLFWWYYRSLFVDNYFIVINFLLYNF